MSISRYVPPIAALVVVAGVVVLVLVGVCVMDEIRAPAALHASPATNWTNDGEHLCVEWRAVPGGRLYLYDGPRGAALCFVPDAPK